MKKSIIAISCIALSLFGCTEASLPHQQKQTINLQKNPIMKNGASIYFFDINKLDEVTKQCYQTSHYYDYGQKFDGFINNNGDFGGNIFSIDAGNKNCAMLPYTNLNDVFNRVSVINTGIEDCADFRYCKLKNLGFNDNNELVGIVGDSIGYNYSQNKINIVKLPVNCSGGQCTLYNTTDFNVLLMPYLLLNLKTGNIIDFSFYKNMFEDERFDYIEGILYGYKGYVNLNESKFYPLNDFFDAVSRNGIIFAHVNQKLVNVYDSIKSNYYQLPIPDSLGVVTSYSPRHLISDDKVLRINTWYNGKSIEFFVNLNTGSWYRLEDLFANLNLPQYRSLHYQLSPNGKYMLIDGTYDTTNILAVKVYFPDGIAKYLQNNVQPIE